MTAKSQRKQGKKPFNSGLCALWVCAAKIDSRRSAMVPQSPTAKSRWLHHHRLDPPNDFFDIFAAVEGADAEPAFAAFSEADAGRDHHVRVLEHPVEHLPTVQAFR